MRICCFIRISHSDILFQSCTLLNDELLTFEMGAGDLLAISLSPSAPYKTRTYPNASGPVLDFPFYIKTLFCFLESCELWKVETNRELLQALKHEIKAS